MMPDVVFFSIKLTPFPKNTAQLETLVPTGPGEGGARAGDRGGLFARANC